MYELFQELFGTFEAQLQFALIALTGVMGWMVFRAHRQITRLSRATAEMHASITKLEAVGDEVTKLKEAATKMQGSLAHLETTGEVVERLNATAGSMQRSLERLEQATSAISRKTEETEETLRSNLEEYRMALGSTNAYREYLQRMGLAPAGDVEPILEALSDGAAAVSADGRVLYTNRAFADLTSVRPGASIDEVRVRCDIRSFNGDVLELDELPESRVLAGETLTGELVRLRPPGRERDLILSVNGQPARDAEGKVVAAVMLSREVSEEIAMAIEVRRLASERDWQERAEAI
jgi:PAS domain-containing protein